MRSRAIRRHHRFRLQRKRKHYYWHWPNSPRKLGRVMSAPKMCSCAGCSGNWERKHLGRITRKEQEADLTMKEQVDTVYVDEPEFDETEN